MTTTAKIRALSKYKIPNEEIADLLDTSIALVAFVLDWHETSGDMGTIKGRIEELSRRGLRSEEIAELIGTSKTYVSTILNRYKDALALSLKKAATYQKSTLGSAHNNYQRWTAREIEYLEENYLKKRATEMALDLKRSYGAIINALNHFGISKRQVI